MLCESSIKQRLRELHAPRVPPPALEAEAEAEAIAAWAARHGAGESSPAASPAGGGAGAGLLGLLLGHRFALAFGALFIAIVAACVMPTSYEVPLGLSVEIRGVEGQELPAREIAHYVRERSDASEVDVLLREQFHGRDGGAPQTLMQIRLWDQGLALGELEPELREQFPSLADAEIIETALEGELETIWGRRLAHRAFRVSLREAELEQAREHLLVQLHGRGLADDEVVVKVRDHDDGHREIEVQIERHDLEGGEGGQGEGFDSVGFGPGFQWVLDPSAPEQVELPATSDSGAVRIQVRSGEDE